MHQRRRSSQSRTEHATATAAHATSLPPGRAAAPDLVTRTLLAAAAENARKNQRRRSSGHGRRTTDGATVLPDADLGPEDPTRGVAAGAATWSDDAAAIADGGRDLGAGEAAVVIVACMRARIYL